jgi:5'-nucleotidase
VRILVTNDDGIKAEGIKQLVSALKSLGEIYVIAPESEKSACGHGITVHHPIKVKKIYFSQDIEAWSVSGTPADCVKLGITTLLKVKPDIVVSGINKGPNLGTDVLYSGTVSGAIEGILHGIPAMAISLNSFSSEDFTGAKIVAQKLCQEMLNKNLAPDTLLNVNVPAISDKEIKGFKVTKLGERKYINNFEHRTDPRGNDYYWLAGQVVPPDKEDEDLDVVAISNNYVSVTPIHFDLTNYRIMKQIKEWGVEKMGI